MSAQLVKTLRDRTQAPLMECKKALTDSNGDLELAVDWLKKKGLDTIKSKLAGRLASQGCIGASVDSTTTLMTGYLVEMNTETDFTAKNEKFRDMTNRMAKLRDQVDREKLTQEMSVLFRENVMIGRTEKLQGMLIGSYLHGGESGVRIGSLVSLNYQSEKPVLDPRLLKLANELALQVVGGRPLYSSIEQVPKPEIEKEKQIIMESDAQLAKRPQDILNKILAGKLDKFYQEIVLTEQPFVLGDTTVTKKAVRVKDMLKQAEKEFSIKNLTCTEFKVLDVSKI